MKQLIGQVSQETIEQWKKDHDTVMAYEVDGRVAYLKQVDRNTYSAAAAKVSTSPAKFNEVIIENIWLGGDDEIRNNDRFYFGLIDFVEELMAKKKGSLKTL